MRILRWYPAALALAALLVGLLVAQPAPPTVSVEFVADPTSIFQKGSPAHPQLSTVKVNLRADALPSQPIDALMGIDRSLPLADVQKFTEELIRIFGGQDRLGLVSLAPSNLDSPLTADFDQIRHRISELTPAGASGLAEALQRATRELETNGRPEAQKLQIWLIGRAGTEPVDFSPVLQQAQRAKERQIAVYVVAGTPAAINAATLLQLARLTNGALLKGLTLEHIVTIKNKVRQEFVAREIVVKVNLTPAVALEQASGNPQTEDAPDGGKTLTWALDKLGPEERYGVTFAVSGAQKGQWAVNRAPSLVEYTNVMGQRVRFPLAPLLLTVANAAPTAKFEFNPELLVADRTRWQPVVGETIVFTSHSADPDGQLVAFAWDFGDGGRSSDQNAIYRYQKAGTYTVRLTVTDNDGTTASTETAVEVLNIVTVIRDLPTFEGKLPRDIIARGYLEIRVARDVLGLGVQEKWPEGLVVGIPADVTRKVLGERHGGSFKAAPDSGTIEWIFPERLPAGTVKRIVYEFKLSAAADPKSLKLEGLAISKLPDLTVPIAGITEFELVEGLPIRVVVAHYITAPDMPPEEERIDLKDDKTISFTQIQRAVSWWLDPNPFAVVPGTGGQKIDLATMQELIAYWLSETPVNQPLPAQPPPPQP